MDMSDHFALADFMSNLPDDDDWEFKIDFVKGKGFMVNIQDRNSCAFSASGFGSTLKEAIEMMEKEMAGEDTPEMPVWARSPF
jgi:hypothetical protein